MTASKLSPSSSGSKLQQWCCSELQYHDFCCSSFQHQQIWCNSMWIHTLKEDFVGSRAPDWQNIPVDKGTLWTVADKRMKHTVHFMSVYPWIKIIRPGLEEWLDLPIQPTDLGWCVHLHKTKKHVRGRAKSSFIGNKNNTISCISSCKHLWTGYLKSLRKCLHPRKIYPLSKTLLR